MPEYSEMTTYGHSGTQYKPEKVRAYTHIHVSKFINISSSGHYFGKVYYKIGDNYLSRDVDLNGGLSVLSKSTWEVLKLPLYVEREICNLFITTLESDAVYFEYDRDKNKRFTELRYHRPDYIPHMIDCLKQELAQIVKKK